MTPQQQADKINALIANWDNLVADTFFTAITRVERDMHLRIFNKHLTADGFGLGTYSTKSGYFTREQFANKGSFKPIGKNENTLGRKNQSFYKKENSYTGEKTKTAYVPSTGLDRKSMYLKNGYKELRAIQGKEIGIVNLQYTGNLSEYGIGVVVNGDDYQVKFLNESSKDKGRGFEKRKRERVFSPSVDEAQNAYTFIATTLLTELKEAFGNV